MACLRLRASWRGQGHAACHYSNVLDTTLLLRRCNGRSRGDAGHCSLVLHRYGNHDYDATTSKLCTGSQRYLGCRFCKDCALAGVMTTEATFGRSVPASLLTWSRSPSNLHTSYSHWPCLACDPAGALVDSAWTCPPSFEHVIFTPRQMSAKSRRHYCQVHLPMVVTSLSNLGNLTVSCFLSICCRLPVGRLPLPPSLEDPDRRRSRCP